jgi:hypothetical protein
MEIVVSDEAKEFVEARGGVVFVYPHSHRCCQGQITMLDTTTTPRTSSVPTSSVQVGGIEVRLHGQAAQQPQQLEIELRGVWRRHVVAFWDGCAYRP